MPPARAADASLAACPVRHWARTAPERIAIHGSGSLSYRRLDARLNGLCKQLEQAGLKAGDRLVAVVRGALEDVLLAWACVRSGLVFCPLNPAFPLPRQAELAAQLDACAFWSAGEIPVGSWSPLRLDFRGELPASEEAWPLEPAQLNNMILTSGSSGTPKAVVHRLANHLASARGSATLIPLDEACGWLLSLPLFHVGGYAILFRVFLAGATLVLDQRERPLKERLECQPITHLSLVPTQLWRLLAEGFDPARTRLRELLLGGAAIPQPLVSRLCAMGLEPKVSYGLSEMGSQVSTAIPGDAGVVGNAGAAIYCASKGGVTVMTKALARELAPHGIRVNALCPGYCHSEMVDPYAEAEPALFEKLLERGKLGDEFGEQADDVETHRHRLQKSGSQSTTMRPASKSTETMYWPVTKGSRRLRSPSTTITSLAPVSNRCETLPRGTPSVVSTARPSRSAQ